MPDEVVLESTLVDVTNVRPEDLAALPASVLSAALHRIFAECSAEPDQYASFESSL